VLTEMIKTNQQIAKEIKQHRRNKIKRAVQRNYSKRFKNKQQVDKEYADSVDKFVVLLPNV
jgi:DNA-binding cell septation regulator SpoVG